MNLRKLKIWIQRPFLKIKWWYTREEKVRSLEMKTPRDMMLKRDEIYGRYLKADKMDDKTEVLRCRTMLNTIDYILNKREKL